MTDMRECLSCGKYENQTDLKEVRQIRSVSMLDWLVT